MIPEPTKQVVQFGRAPLHRGAPAGRELPLCRSHSPETLNAVRQKRAHILSGQALKPRMSEHQDLSASLLVYCKKYASEQIKRALLEPIRRYFLMLQSMAQREAPKKPGQGKYKELVVFQELVGQIPRYDEQKQSDVCAAILHDTKVALNTALRAALVTNGMIIGSFGRTPQTAAWNRIPIPSDAGFIHAVMCTAGRGYFSDPEAYILSPSESRVLVAEAIATVMEDIFPFEAMVGPVVRKYHRYKASLEDKGFAEQFVEEAGKLSDNEVKDLVQRRMDEAEAEPQPEPATEEEPTEEEPAEEQEEDQPAAHEDDLGFVESD